MIKLTKKMVEIVLKSSNNFDNSIKLQRICLYDMKHISISAELKARWITEWTDQYTQLVAFSTAHAHYHSDDRRCEALRKWSDASVFKSRGQPTVKSSLADTSLSILIVSPCSRYAGKSQHCLIRTGFIPSSVPPFLSLESTFWC